MAGARQPSLGVVPGSRARRTPRNIVVLGNSTSSVMMGNWPATFATLRPRDTVQNISVVGGDTQGFINSYASLLPPTWSSTLPNELIFFEGANYLDFNFDDGHGHSFGLGITTGAQSYAKTQQFLALARADGWKIYIITLDHWKDTDFDLPSFYAAIDNYNATAKANPSDWDVLLDFGGLSGFDPENDPVPYYSDGTHKTTAGQIKMGQLIAGYYTAAVGV